MKRSTQVAAPLLASTALALLAGCHSPEMQRCVDENNKVVDDSLCKDLPGGSAQQTHHPGLFPYHYYYGGFGGRGVGSLVTGGSATPLAGHSYATGTSRGGFGHTFSEGGAHGSSGGGEGGGHGGGGGE